MYMITRGEEEKKVLNEIIEYKQYSFDCIHDREQGRLKHKALISNSFSGIGRAITTIARYYMFQDNDKESSLSQESEQRALVAIKLWCGAKSIGYKTPVEEVRDWLPHYIRFVLLNRQIERFQKDTKTIDGLLDEERQLIDQITDDVPEEKLYEVAEQLRDIYSRLDDEKRIAMHKNWVFPIVNCIDRLYGLISLRKRFGYHMFQFEFKKSDSNDIKAINYEKALADAFQKGSLKRYYLCCDDSSIIKNCSQDKLDVILKTIASCLLNRNNALAEQKWVLINKTDIVNWLKKINKADDYKPDASIFQMQKIGGNMVKISVDDSWIKHFYVVEESMFRKEDWEKGVFYSDKGSHYYLEENTLY